MSSRLIHLRAAFLLSLSSALVFWIVSYWFPFAEYLAFISSEGVKEYELILKIVVSIFISFCLINLLVAGLIITKLSKGLKFYLALLPAAVFFLTPFIAAIPISLKFKDRNYFEVFQAMFRLFRFTKVDTFVFALIVITLATILNVLAAVLIRRSSEPAKLSSKLRMRYLIYTGVISLVIAGFTTANLVNSSYRALDRKSCQQYSIRALPATEEEVPTFLSDVMLYGQSAGTKSLQNAFIDFSMISRQYFAALGQDVDSQTMAQLEFNVSEAKDKVTLLCSEFGPETETPKTK